jgi:thioredoxin 1
MKNILILIICIFLSSSSVWAQTTVSTDEFQAKLAARKDAQLIDVRTPAEYNQGHLAKASNIDYKNPAFKEQIGSLDKSKPVFVYCLAGSRSAAAAGILHEAGFKEVYDMKGGYMQWTSSGKLIENRNERNAAKGMNAADFKKLVASSDIVLIDFYAPWCEPCIKMLPVVNKLKQEYKSSKAKLVTIEYDGNKDLAKELKINEIPAFLIYKNGVLTDRKSGLLSEPEFRKILDGK